MDPYAPMYAPLPADTWILPGAPVPDPRPPAVAAREDKVKQQRRLIVLLVLALLLAGVAIAMPYATGTWRRLGLRHGPTGLLDPQALQNTMVGAYSRGTTAPERAVCIETSRRREFICDLKYATLSDQAYRVFVSADGEHWIATPYFGN